VFAPGTGQWNVTNVAQPPEHLMTSLFAPRTKSKIGERPPSVASLWGNSFGLVALLLAFAVLWGSPMHIANKIMICFAAAAIPMMAFDLLVRKVYRRESAGLKTGGTGSRTGPHWFPYPLNWRRSCLKLLGLWVTLGAMGFLYWIFPEYQKEFYSQYWGVLIVYFPYYLIIAVPYFLFVDAWMTDPRDGYLYTGMLALGRWQDLDWGILREHFLGWVIKAYFIALMFSYCIGNLEALFAAAAGTTNWAFLTIFVLVLAVIFAVDVIIAVLGYVLALRVLDTHVRSVNPFVYAWFVNLVVYEPFWAGFRTSFFEYENGFYWAEWLASLPALQMIWGSAIVFLYLIYIFSMITIGYRFSNLVHRGIVTNGAFAISKHPAYLSKNVCWWLISVPFVANGSWDEALTNSVLLAGLNLIYYLRGKSEEHHLSRDPTYVAYALWMNDHGPLRFLNRLFPFLRYQPPKDFSV
jgi:hypothetical protein